MGDRYDININCVYCNTLNKDVYYAPTCSSDVFKCRKCGKKNFINSNFKAVKIEDVTFEKIKEGFLNTTMGMLADKQIDRGCKEHLKEIRGELK